MTSTSHDMFSAKKDYLSFLQDILERQKKIINKLYIADFSASNVSWE